MSCGLVVAVYWPGKRRTLFDTSDAESDIPRVVFDEPCRHWPATHTMEELEAATGALEAKRRTKRDANMGRRETKVGEEGNRGKGVAILLTAG